MPDEIMLNYLGKGYFHEDYDLDADSPALLVRKFAMDEYRGYVQIMERELSEILEAGLTEVQARTLWLEDADAYYEPTHDGKSYLDWLNEILEIVRVALRERPADDDD